MWKETVSPLRAEEEAPLPGITWAWLKIHHPRSGVTVFGSSKRHKGGFNTGSLKKGKKPREKSNSTLTNSYWKHIKLTLFTDLSQNFFTIKYSPTSEHLWETPGISTHKWMHLTTDSILCLSAHYITLIMCVFRTFWKWRIRGNPKRNERDECTILRKNMRNQETKS